MNTMEEHKLKDANAQMVQQAKKHPIICKFWMMGNCIKDEKCDYLHTERDKNKLQNFSKGFNRAQSGTIDCPMYRFGYCKNGSLCNYKHTKEEKADEVLESMELPLWFLEYVFEKPANLIFQEFEEQNKEETDELKEKYFPNHKKFQKLPRLYKKNQPNKSHQFDIYAEKKDSIIASLNKKVRYFFIRNKNMDYVQFAMENNFILNNKQNSIKFTEAQKSCDEVVFIIFDEEHMNFNGFCRFKKEMDEKEVQMITDNYMTTHNKDLLAKYQASNINFSFLKVEWHWKTKLSYNKVELLKNPLSDNEQFVYSKDGQEVSIDLGHYVCRFMIKRLTREEVQGYLEYKKFYEENKGIAIDKDYSRDKNNQSLVKAAGNNGLDLNTLIYDEINKSGKGPNGNTTSNNSSNGSIIVTNISNLQVNISQNSYTYQSKDGKNSRNSYYEKKEKKSYKDRRDRSTSRRNKKSKRRNNSRSPSLSSTKSKSRSFRREKDEKRRDHTYSKYKEKYDSDDTLIYKEEPEVISLSPDDSPKLLQNKRKGDDLIANSDNPKIAKIDDKLSDKSTNLKNDITPSSKHNNSLTNDSNSSTPKLIPDSKIPAMKNKLFSNAMEKIALNYNKKDIGKNYK